MQLAPLAAALSLFSATFVQEGVALAYGAAIIINGTLSPTWVALSLFAGIVAGDCCVYAFGRLARHSAWAQRWIANIDLEKTEAWLNKNLLFVVPTAHLMPSLLFPTFAALGWFKVSFPRFVSASFAFNAVYVPLALYALTYAGRTAVPYLTNRPWLLWLAAAALLTALIALRFRRANAPS